MSRGPLPKRALDTAIEIAEQRGIVQKAERGPVFLYDFTIVGTSPVAFIRVKYFPRILALLDEIAAEFRHEIHLLRSITRGAAVSLELWLRSRHGTWRFFRVAADGIVELGRDGRPPGGKTGTAPGPVAG
jgi:hypothetical protein